MSWCALDGDCYFLLCSGWSLLFSGVLWMVTVISLLCSRWLLLFPGVLGMVTVICWCALDGYCYLVLCSGWLLLFLGVPVPQGCWSEPGQAASGTMANVTRSHGCNWWQASRYTVQEGVACQAERPRNSSHKGEAVVP